MTPREFTVVGWETASFRPTTDKFRAPSAMMAAAAARDSHQMDWRIVAVLAGNHRLLGTPLHLFQTDPAVDPPRPRPVRLGARKSSPWLVLGLWVHSGEALVCPTIQAGDCDEAMDLARVMLAETPLVQRGSARLVGAVHNAPPVLLRSEALPDAFFVRQR